MDSKKETPLFDFSNISIKYGNTDITGKFNEPVLSEDKTVLTIIPNSTEFNEFLSDIYNVTYANINISLDPRTLFDVNGNYLYFAEDNSLNFTVHYCTTIETGTPSMQKFGVYKSWDTTTDKPLVVGVDESENDIVEEFTLKPADFIQDKDSWDNWEIEELKITDKQFAKHITGEYVYIYGKYIDYQSDVKTIVVEEYFEDAFNPFKKTNSIIKEYTKNSDEVILWKQYSSGAIEFCIKKKLLSEDGIISLRTIVKDTYGNPSEIQEVCVIKSTHIDSLFDAALTNVPVLKYVYSGDEDFDMDEYKDELRDIKLIYYDYKNHGSEVDETLIAEDYDFRPTYGYRYINPSEVYKTIKCQYYKDNGELGGGIMQPKEYTEEDYEGAIKWHFYIPEEDVADLNNLKVRVIIEDKVGNTCYQDYYFPGKTELIIDEKINSKRYLRRYQENNNTMLGLIVYGNDDDGWKVSYRWYDPLEIPVSKMPDGTEFYLISTGDNCLTSQLNQKFIAGNKPQGTHSIDYDSISYEKIEDEQIRINCRIKDSSLNYFDSIMAKFTYDDYQFELHAGHYYLKKGEKSIKIEKYTSSLYSDDYKLVLYGIKNGVASIKEIEIPKFTDPKYDNINPKLIEAAIPSERGQTMRFPDYYYILPKDDQSGIARIEFNGKLVELPVISDDKVYSYILNFNNDKTTIQPVLLGNKGTDVENSTLDGAILLHYYDILDYSLGFPCANVEIKISDKANNVFIKKINQKITEEAPIVVTTRTTNSQGLHYWKVSPADDPNSLAFGLGVDYFNNTKKTWVNYASHVSWRYNAKQQVPKDYFVRFYNTLSIPTYYYVTEKDHDVSNDSIALIGSSSQIQVYSNDPVLVQTIVTPRSYSVCKDWTKEEWLFYKKIIGEEVFYLSSSNTRAIYNIPLDQINQDECYVVIAHFADGSSIMSEVMVKE